MAKLYFRYGAMNSGKSIQILSVAHNYEERGKKVIVLKPSIDTLCDNSVHSRIGIHREAHVVLPNDNLFGIANGYDCVLVDEAQFLSEDQVDQLMGVVISGIPVICYGLRTDYKTRSFEGSRRLLEIAHSIEEIKTICSCGQKAIFSAKINGDTTKYTDDKQDSQIDIEDIDNPKYMSLCATCYNLLNNTWNQTKG